MSDTRSEFEILKLSIEALLFSAEMALSASDLREVIENVSLIDIRIALKDLTIDCASRSYDLVEHDNKYCFKTKAEFGLLLKRRFQAKPKSFSKLSMETLAIIAYRQPVTRAEVNAIRGVDSATILSNMVDQGYAEVCGKRKEVGSPLEYRTTAKFLEAFALQSLKDLPNLRSLQIGIEDVKQIAESLNELDGLVQHTVTPEELSFPDKENVAF